MTEWDQKSKPHKIPRASNKTPKNAMPNFWALKISREEDKFCWTLNTELWDRGHFHESFGYSNWPKKSLHKSSHPKKYLPNFPSPKNPGIENFKPNKILRSPRPLKSGVTVCVQNPICNHSKIKPRLTSNFIWCHCFSSKTKFAAVLINFRRKFRQKIKPHNYRYVFCKKQRTRSSRVFLNDFSQSFQGAVVNVIVK